MVGGIWANTNYDDSKESKGHRQNALEAIDRHFDEAIDAMYAPPEPDIDMSNPFFAAMKLPDEIDDSPEQSRADVVELRPDIDQA